MVRQAHQVGLDHLPAHLNRVKAFQHEPLPENIRSQILHRLAFLGYIVLIWPRPLRFQGRFASKAASLPRPLRFQGRIKLKLTMKTMKSMKFFYSFFMVFMSFMVEHFLAQNARCCLSRYD